METAEIKLRIFRYIDSLDKKHLLDFYKQIFEKEADFEKDFRNDLTDIQKKDIEAGLSDLKNGKRKKIEDIFEKFQM